MSLKYVFLILFFVAGCAPAPAPSPEPTKVPLGGIAQGAETKPRAASMRIVEAGRVELNQLHFERAAAQFSRAIEIDSSNPFAYFYLGLVRQQNQSWSQAADLFLRAADLFAAFPSWRAEALACRGECLEKMGQLESARKVFQKAIETDSSNLRARNGLDRIGA